MIGPDRVDVSRDYAPAYNILIHSKYLNYLRYFKYVNLLKASVVVDFKLAVLASLEFLDVDGGAVPKIALTSSESNPSLSPDLLKSSGLY